MAKINSKGYVTAQGNENLIVKAMSKGKRNVGVISLSRIELPKDLIGTKLRLKIEHFEVLTKETHLTKAEEKLLAKVNPYILKRIVDKSERRRKQNNEAVKRHYRKRKSL